MQNIAKYISELNNANPLALARCITIVENNLEGSQQILESLSVKKTIPVIGITGPPGAGKSTLVNALIDYIISEKSDTKIGIIAIDPTSPFNFGSLLGDRVRMVNHFNNPNIFIRSIATRGSLGGLSAKALEITDVMKAFGFDYIIVETVGVGQSEVEIVGLADTTIVVLVPEAGDEVQALKSGVMEIADIFVVNKADRSGANTFLKNIYTLLHNKPNNIWNTAVVKTIASKNEGIEKLFILIEKHIALHLQNPKKINITAEKIYKILQQKMMAGVDKNKIIDDIKTNINNVDFNIYKYAEGYLKRLK